jgi:hypothetical protein
MSGKYAAWVAGEFSAMRSRHAEIVPLIFEASDIGRVIFLLGVLYRKPYAQPNL